MSESDLPLLARAIFAALGALLIYVAFFLYEDEEGRIQGVLESWWTRAFESEVQSVNRVNAFFQAAVALTNLGLDALFGTALFARKALVTSICLSFASIIWAGTILGNSNASPLDVTWLVAFLCLAIMPLALSNSKAETVRAFLVLLALAVLFSMNHRHYFGYTPGDNPIFGQEWLGLGGPEADDIPRLAPSGLHQEGLAMVLGLLFAISSDFIFVLALRALYRWVQGLSLLRLLLACLGMLILAVILLAVPAIVPWFSSEESAVTAAANLAFLSNFYSVFTSILFLLSGFAIVLYRFTRPIATRLVYALSRYELLRKKKMLGFCGTVLLVAAFPSTKTIVQSVIDIFSK